MPEEDKNSDTANAIEQEANDVAQETVMEAEGSAAEEPAGEPASKQDEDSGDAKGGKDGEEKGDEGGDAEDQPKSHAFEGDHTTTPFGSQYDMKEEVEKVNAEVAALRIQSPMAEEDEEDVEDDEAAEDRGVSSSEVTQTQSTEDHTGGVRLGASNENIRKITIDKLPKERIGFMVTESSSRAPLPTVFVSHVFPNGPAARNGELHVGDLLLEVNGASVVGLPFEATIDIIRKLSLGRFVTLTLLQIPASVTCRVQKTSDDDILGIDVLDGEITHVLKGSLAAKAEIPVGTRIAEINGMNMVNRGHVEIIEALREHADDLELKLMPIHLYDLMTANLDTQKHIMSQIRASSGSFSDRGSLSNTASETRASVTESNTKPAPGDSQ
eukprot:Clim_evm42s191 gene=Clim_evmTU42s191